MNKKSLIYSIIAILLITIIVTSSTFAYFQWTSSESQRTSVSVNIERTGVSMVITPTETEFTGLYPVADCNNSNAVGLTEITITNDTNVAVVPSLKLSVKVTKGGTGVLISSVLSHIHYAVVSVTDGDTPDLCSEPLTASDTGLFNNGNQLAATGTFSTVSTTGEWSNLPSTEGVYLPRQYNNGKTSGVTFVAPARQTTTEWFAVYVWIDSNYAAISIGDTISDPLQNAKIEKTTTNMIQKISPIFAVNPLISKEI